MPKAFSDTERKRITARLIASGKRRINQMGIRHLVVDDVAQDAGISKGSFYSFFPSREDFILSVLEAWETEYRGELLRQITEGGGSARERLERFFLGAFEILEREPGLANVRQKEIQAIIDRLPPERIAAHQARDSEVLTEAFQRWSRHGLLAADLSEAFRGLVPALFSIAIHREDFPPGTYAPAVRLIAQSLALKIASTAAGKGRS